MKKLILLISAVLLSAVMLSAKEDKDKKDWGYLTGSLESTNHVYVEDVANDFYPSWQTNLNGGIFATNNYLKLDYYKDRLSAGMQMEGYFPTLVGYPIPENKLSISNLYATWRDKSYSVTAGTFYEQFGSGLLFRSWEDRPLGLNNAMLGARATYNWGDNLAFKAFWGIPRLGKIGGNAAMMGEQGTFFGLGLSKVNVAGADLSLSLSNMAGWNAFDLTLEGSVINKHEAVPEFLAGTGCKPNTIGWSGRVNFDFNGFFAKGEYVDAGKQIASVADMLQGGSAKKGNAQLIELGYNGRGLGLTVTGRRLERMTQKIYSYSVDELGYEAEANMLSYRPAMSTQYTYMLTTLNPYAPHINGEIGGQIDAFYNFRRGTAIGGKRGMKIHANFSTYYALNETGGMKGADFLFRDFSFDLEKQWTKSFKMMVLYSAQEYNDHNDYTSDLSHIVVADLLYKWTPKLSSRLELQYLSTKNDQGDWMAALLEVSFAPHWSVFGSEMWNHGGTKLHYYNAGVSFSMKNIRLAAGYGRYKAGFICSGGVCRPIPAYTGANLSLNVSF